MQIIKYKIFYLIFSALVLVPGILSLIFWGMKLSIDFTGGSVIKYQFEKNYDSQKLRELLKTNNIEVVDIKEDLGDLTVIRTAPLAPDKLEDTKTKINTEFKNSAFKSFETVGPVIGKETTSNAFVSLFWASIGILLYIAYAFRNIPKPYSSFRFGISAVLAMLHDAFVVIGVFSILGHFYNLEVDSLFITAMLTIIGFSVHDTIVVFDRIRENLSRLPKNTSFEDVVNYSVVETLGRSIATSLTVVITLTALLILGGDSIKNFTLAMLIGIISGTYSSVFTASPILVLWEELISKRKNR